MQVRTLPFLLLSLALLGAGIALGAFVLSPRGDGASPAGAWHVVPADPETAPPSLGGRDTIDADGVVQLRARVAELERGLRAEEAARRAAERERDALASALADAGRERARPSTLSPTEMAAYATLRNGVSAQAQIQATGRIDTDHDGVGEYGGFLEMTGTVAGRMGRPLVPPVMATAFGQLTPEGVAVRGGYCYRIYLPDRHGRGVGEPQTGFQDDGLVDPDLAETTWCLYAWPQSAAQGTRTFFVNQAGDVLVAEDTGYLGPAGTPPADAAFLDRGYITGAVAIGREGSDGHVWRP